jgi:hypothetical protein
MERVIDPKSLREILERGLITGKWSITQFNKGGGDLVLPTKEFLEANPQFLDASFRDLDAYRSTHVNQKII